MKDLQTTISNKWRQIIYLLIAFLVILIIQDVLREIIIFNNEINTIENELVRDVYDDVKDLVVSADDDMSFIIGNLHESAIIHAEEVLSDLQFAADSVVAFHEDRIGDDIDEEIISLAILYNDKDSLHQHYVYNTDGIQIVDAKTNTITNIDINNVTDDLDRAYLDMLFTQIDSSPTGSSYVSMYVMEDDVLKEYILYGHHVEGTEMIITSYISFDTYSETQKAITINHLAEIYDQYTNTVYVISGQGEILYHQNSEAIGLSVDDSTYPVWQETLQIILDFVEREDEGYLEYKFYSNYSNGVITQKVAYVSYFEEWDLIVGASSDRDVYSDILAQYRQSNYQTVLLIKLPSYLILLGLGILLFKVVKNNIYRSQKVLHTEKLLYQKFADFTSQIIMITNQQGELLYTNKLGSEIIFGKRDPSTTINFDQIMVEEDGYYILYGIKQDMFVKYITEDIEFNEEQAILYIITDVTDKITKERQLEALSMRDDLTSLGNRRLMVKDYNDKILPYVRNGGIAHMVMIDLDDFKPANDTYGHSFGDFVLKEIAKIFIHVTTENVQFYRIGGDEFAIIFMSMTTDEVISFVKQLQTAIGNHSYEKSVEVGFSAGGVQIIVSDHKRRFSDFYDAADQKLYESKDKGKNTITF